MPNVVLGNRKSNRDKCFIILNYKSLAFLDWIGVDLVLWHLQEYNYVLYTKLIYQSACVSLCYLKFWIIVQTKNIVRRWGLNLLRLISLCYLNVMRIWRGSRFLYWWLIWIISISELFHKQKRKRKEIFFDNDGIDVCIK